MRDELGPEEISLLRRRTHAAGGRFAGARDERCAYACRRSRLRARQFDGAARGALAEIAYRRRGFLRRDAATGAALGRSGTLDIGRSRKLDAGRDVRGGVLQRDLSMAARSPVV